MTEIFDVKVPDISKYLNNIFEINELEENSVIPILETTDADYKNYLTLYYSLDCVERVLSVVFISALSISTIR